MAYLIAGLLSFLGLLLLGQALRDADPHKIAQGLRAGGAIGLGAIALFLMVTGRFVFAIPLGVLAVSLLRPGIWGGLGLSGGGTGQKTAGTGQSGVETATLRMVLDHRTGTLDGEILQGPWSGKWLSELDLSTALELRDWAIAHDPASVALVESYLDRTHSGWRGHNQGSSAGQQAGYGMTRARALDILGLSDGATDAEIKAAHRKMMQQAHPDHGGSAEWAAELNSAKDCLLGR